RPLIFLRTNQHSNHTFDNGTISDSVAIKFLFHLRIVIHTSLFVQSPTQPNNKRHTLKTIKNRDTLHPSGRKASQLTRVLMRNDRLEKKMAERRLAANPLVERWLWFRYALDDTLPCATRLELHDLIDMYLKRHDEELTELKALHRKGQRPKAAREDLLIALIKKERDEYAKGFGACFAFLSVFIDMGVGRYRWREGDGKGRVIMVDALM
ncbi:hypothetical protein BC936DRAFT_138901, partial [Jimgerdemannia flammicorona]